MKFTGVHLRWSHFLKYSCRPVCNFIKTIKWNKFLKYDSFIVIYQVFPSIPLQFGLSDTAADLVTFTEEIFHGELHLLCSVNVYLANYWNGLWRTLLKKHTYHNKLGSSCPCNMIDIGTEEILLLQHTVHRLSMVHLRMDVLCRIFHRRKIHHTYT